MRGNIDENAKIITINLPDGTDLTSLTPDIGYIGFSVSPSGAQDFTARSRAYTVTPVTGSSVQYMANLYSHPSVSGSNALSGMVGSVGAQTVTATISGSCLESITLTATVGGKTATASRTGDGTVSITFAAGDLNTLALGSYDITVSAAATPSNAAIASTNVGTLTVVKKAPSVTGINALSGTVGDMGAKTATVTVSGSYPESISLTATVGGKTAAASRTGDGTVSFTFAASDLNTLAMGSYDIMVSAAATTNNEAIASTNVGTLTVGKYAPSISGSNALSGTVGDMGGKTVTATVSGSYPESISLTATVGGKTAAASRTGDGTVSFTFESSDLNTLAPGSYDITVSAAATTYNEAIATTNVGTLTVLSSLPASYKMYTGGRVTWDPKPDGGTWDWDEEYFSATFNSPATFTALKPGTSTITYTVNDIAQSVTVTIRQAELPHTGQDVDTWIWVLASLIVVCGTAAVLIGKRVKLQK